MGELEDLTAEDDIELDFEITACELFGATIEEINSVKRKMMSSNDHKIDWDALAEAIVDVIAEAEDAVDQESGGEEKTLSITRFTS